MTPRPIEKFKSLLISACESAQAGHRDIANNLMELASEELVEIDPNDLDSMFMTTIVEEQASDDEAWDNSDDEEDSEESQEVAHMTFRDIVKGMTQRGGKTVS